MPIIVLPRGAIHCSSTVRCADVLAQQPCSQATRAMPVGACAAAAVVEPDATSAATTRRIGLIIRILVPLREAHFCRRTLHGVLEHLQTVRDRNAARQA